MKRNESDTKRSESNEESEGYDRRSFMAVTGVVGGLGAFAGASGTSASDLGGQFAKNDAGNDDTSSEGDDGDDENSQNDTDLPTGTEALVGYIGARYGDRLSEEELASIKADIGADLEAAASIDAVPLENGDAPAFDFAVYRGGE